MSRKIGRILVTNDDGVNASGLAVLEEIAAELSDDVWTVAPLTEQSGAAHSLTLTRPLRLRRVGEQRYAVEGTPTDCVMLAVHHLMTGGPPGLVLSGVNRGSNLAEDVTYSGTIAGAMEGAVAGVPSIALSQSIAAGERRANWEIPRACGARLVRRLFDVGWPSDVFLNVNFPAVALRDLSGTRVAAQGRRDLGGLVVEQRTDPRGYPYYWFRLARENGEPLEETDLHAVSEGCIAVTALQLDLTHRRTCDRLRGALDSADPAR